MTRVTPSGTHGQDVANGESGGITGVTKAGTGTIKYSTTHGFSRGNNVSIHIVSNAVADQANFQVDDTDQPWATNQAYWRWPKWPTIEGTASATTEFLANRASGNSARLVLTGTGTVLLHNATGNPVGTWTGSAGNPPQLALNQEYRFRLKSTPGNSSTTGQATAEIWNADTDALIASVTVTGQNFGGTATNLNHTSGRYGDASTTVGANFEGFVTMPEFVTGASSAPEVAAIPKIVINAPPTVSADKASYDGDDTVTLTVSTDTATVAVTGVIPAPVVSDTGTTRTFIAPRVTNTTTLTITVTDPEGLTGSTTVSILQARARILYNGSWTAYYSRVQIANPDLPLTTQVARYRADILTGSEGAEMAALPSWNGLVPDAVQATAANRPILRRGAINGHHAVEMDGNRWFNLQGTALDLARNRGNLLLFVVYKLPSVDPGGVRTLFSLSVGTGSGGRMSLYDSNGTSPRAAGRRLDGDSFLSIAGGTRIAGETAVLTASFRWATAELLLYKNGALVASSTTFHTPGGQTSDTSSLTGFIGVNGVNPSETFVGMISEILIYADADTSGALRQEVHSYVQDTYAIPVADYSVTPDSGE